jgi:integrase
MFVFRPRRRVNGEMRVSPLWSGRYRLDDMKKPVEVPLNTIDELVARKRLTDIVIRIQREREGILPPQAQVVALGLPIRDLVTRYAADLKAQGRTVQHIKDTSRRILRVAREAKWKSLHDVTAVSFTAWRSGVATTVSAKTLKEYQVSANAFFRWLQHTGQLEENPLRSVRMPQTRGREKYRRRAFTPDEITRLLPVASHRRLPYLFLLYTGCRYREAHSLLWSDVRLDDPSGPHVLLRAERTKDREARSIPLHPALAAELRKHRVDRANDGPSVRVFRDIYPTQTGGGTGRGSLNLDMERAGIAKRDESGRVLDFHSFRKTWQTMAVRAGIPLRVSQAILGHSTPDLTANAYTDVAGLELHVEAAKLPWFGAADQRTA